MCFAVARARNLGNAWWNAITTARHHIQIQPFSNDTSFVCYILFPFKGFLAFNEEVIYHKSDLENSKPKRYIFVDGNLYI